MLGQLARKAALFVDMWLSPTRMEASRIADFVGCTKGFDEEVADAEMAYVQAPPGVNMKFGPLHVIRHCCLDVLRSYHGDYPTAIFGEPIAEAARHAVEHVYNTYWFLERHGAAHGVLICAPRGRCDSTIG